MKNKIIITVTGKAGTGKSLISEKINEVLSQNGIESIVKNLDGESARESARKALKEDRLCTLSSKLKVIIKEVQANRNFGDYSGVDVIEYINKINACNPSYLQVILFKKDVDSDKYIRDIMSATMVIQETNIKDFYFIHKSRHSENNVMMKKEELLSHLEDYYEP